MDYESWRRRTLFSHGLTRGRVVGAVGFLNVSRNSKIRIAVVCVVAGVIAGFFLLERFRGGVRVTFAGASPKDSNLVSFSITNSFRNPVVYYLEGQLEVNGVWESNRVAWPGNTFWYSNYTGRIMGRAAETIEVKFDCAHRWRFFVLYGDSWSTTFVGRTKAQFAREASRHGWNRLSQWLRPMPRFIRMAGPEMLGNRPAPPAQP